MREHLRDSDVIVRPMEPGDIAQVVEIDRQSFLTPWPDTTYRRDLRSPLMSYVVACVPDGCTRAEESPLETGEPRGLQGIVRALRNVIGTPPAMPTDDCILGYAGLWFMVDEAHITTIAVRPEWRRHGAGEAMLIALTEKALSRGERVLTLETRVSNEEAQKLYEKYGFTVTGQRLRYYSDNQEDALIMSTDRLVSERFQAVFRQCKREYAQRWGRLPARVA